MEERQSRIHPFILNMSIFARSGNVSFRADLTKAPEVYEVKNLTLKGRIDGMVLVTCFGRELLLILSGENRSLTCGRHDDNNLVIMLDVTNN